MPVLRQALCPNIILLPHTLLSMRLLPQAFDHCLHYCHTGSVLCTYATRRMPLVFYPMLLILPYAFYFMHVLPHDFYLILILLPHMLQYKHVVSHSLYSMILPLPPAAFILCTYYHTPSTDYSYYLTTTTNVPPPHADANPEESDDSDHALHLPQSLGKAPIVLYFRYYH